MKEPKRTATRSKGFAPTSRAAGQLREEGIEATTLQSFLARGQNHPSANTASPHLYMLDESSLASTKQMRAFLDKIKPEDRVLVIGDTAQHQGVDAGRPFEQMQDAGMRTSQLDQIVRQKDPALLEAVQHLAKGETAKGIEMLAQQGRITQIADPNERITAIARDYAANPERTIIVSPDNRSRQLINQAVRVELQEVGKLGAEQKTFSVLAHRSDMTGADREWAARYKAGDILKYEKGSKAHGIARNSTAVVLSADARNNTVTVQQDGGKAITYDPKRLKGVNAYRETQKEFRDRRSDSVHRERQGFGCQQPRSRHHHQARNRTDYRPDGRQERTHRPVRPGQDEALSTTGMPSLPTSRKGLPRAASSLISTRTRPALSSIPG